VLGINGTENPLNHAVAKPRNEINDLGDDPEELRLPEPLSFLFNK
jgi:hypothetical protein